VQLSLFRDWVLCSYSGRPPWDLKILSQALAMKLSKTMVKRRYIESPVKWESVQWVKYIYMGRLQNDLRQEKVRFHCKCRNKNGLV